MLALVETLLIFLLFAVFAASPPPATNEAHYLSKAKHYWNPQWCPEDHFLESGYAHLVFFWTCGWTTCWLSLSNAAWCLRIINWLALACAWRWLNVGLVSRPMAAVFSAGLLLVGLWYGPMMGEWVIGGIEGKSIAYVFVVFSLGMLVRDRWNWSWTCLGVATMFHVLVGGWSAVALGVVWLAAGRHRPLIRSILPGIVIAGILSLAGLLPALLLNHGVLNDVMAEANHIYVFRRLPHHLVFHLRPLRFVASHLILVLLWGMLSAVSWKIVATRRLHTFVAAAVAIALTGVAIDLGTMNRPEWAASLLRFYWFRLSDAAVPIGTAVAAIGVICELAARRPRIGRWCDFGTSLFVLYTLGAVWYPHWTDPRPLSVAQAYPVGKNKRYDVYHRYLEWIKVCDWIEHTTHPADRFLTPLRQQTFKWYASRSEAATWKDFPQDAPSVIEWWKRFNKIYRPNIERPSSQEALFLANLSQRRLLKLARQYDCQYILFDRSRGDPVLRHATLVYPLAPETNVNYSVYAVPSIE